MLSKKVLYGTFEIIQKKIVNINYWKGPKKSETTFKNSKQSRPSTLKKGKEFNEYLITLIYIRQAWEMEVLAQFFGVSQSYISSVITTWINISRNNTNWTNFFCFKTIWRKYFR